MTPSPPACHGFSTVAAAVALLESAPCRAVAVLDEDRAVGIATEHEVVAALARDTGIAGRRIAEIMTEGATVGTTATLSEAEAKLRQTGATGLLVVDGSGQPVGFIAANDVARHRATSAQAPRPEPTGVHGASDERAAAEKRPPSARRAAPTSKPEPQWRDLWGLLRDAAKAWSAHSAPRLGAALAYYTVFAIGPLLLIATAVAALVYGKEAAQGRVAGQVAHIVGGQVAEALEAMVASAHRHRAGVLATGVGFVLLFFSAMGLFVQVQDAVNTAWDVQPKPGRGWLGIVKDRALSFLLVLVTIILLLVTLVLSTTLAALPDRFGGWFATEVGQVLDLFVSFVVATLLFAMIYRFLPDARVAWRDVWLGAAVTSLLFSIGKTVIGLYLGMGSVTSAYGAAGSLIALMIWTYYSAQIFLFGAEFTQVYANRFGSRIELRDGKPAAAPARNAG